MKTSILKIGNGECISDGSEIDINGISHALGKCGHFVEYAVCLSDSDEISATFKSLLEKYEAILVCGDVHRFYDAMSQEYNISRKNSVFAWNDALCVVSATCDAAFLSETLIPAFNGHRKTCYATSVFRTIGKTEEQLRELLKDYVKNRNKISFKFITKPPECSVLIRYSNKTHKDTVAEILHNVGDLLKDCVYSYDDEIDLSTKVADLLIRQGKTLGVAESFTGGNIAASLVRTAGISQAFKEGIVCYSDHAKHNRLRVSQDILDHYGAVSDEVAYEMAANLLVDGQYDYVIATTGNAGPTSEKPNEVGICYIAIGDRNAVDVYKEHFEGDRETVISCGTQMALFYLYRKIRAASPQASAPVQEEISQQ